MIVYTVPQLLEMSDGTTPEAFKGTIKKVFSPNFSKPDAKTKWKMQKVILTGDGKEIEIVFKDRDDVPRTAEGSPAYFVAGRGERGLKGLSRKENNYQNKTTPQVWVYDSAEFTIEGPSGQIRGNASGTNGEVPKNQQPSGAQDHQPPTNQRPTNGPAGGAKGQRSKEERDAARDAAIDAFNKRIARTSSALNRCFDAAVKVVADVNARHGNALGKPSPELLEKIAMGMMVNACWTEKPAENVDFPMSPFQAYAKPTGDDGHAPPNGTNVQRQGAPFSAS